MKHRPQEDDDLLVFLGDVINGLLLASEGKPYVHIRKSGLRY